LGKPRGMRTGVGTGNLKATRSGSGPRLPDASIHKPVPYGIYDLRANTCWVTVGCDGDTAAFAVATLRRWRPGREVRLLQHQTAPDHAPFRRI